MKKIIILLALCSFFAVPMNLGICQGGNFADFLPLQVGNVWVYQCTVSQWGSTCYSCGYCTRRVRVSVTNTNIINGRTYYQSQVTTVLVSGNCNPGVSCGAFPFSSNIRVDSLSANLLSYTTSGCQWLLNETLLDSFKARLHDSIRYNCQPPAQWNAYVCTDTNNVTIFGSSRQARTHTFTGFEYGSGESYAKGIGLYGTSLSVVCGNGACYGGSQLRGCVINGIVYGDTSMLVGIRQISNEVPDKFTLYQNYPNPFNPNTVVRFQLPATGFTKLIIYDVLGREVATLVNEKLKTGTYEVEWDGSNFPSGVYFYKLDAEEYTGTKSMVLLK